MRLFGKNYKALSDEELMTLYTKGDHSAFQEVYNRYEKFMVNFFYRKLWNDRIKAEDFAHDLFTKIIDNPNLFDAQRNFKAWIFSVANNMCKNEYKKQEIRKNTGYDVPEHYQGTDQNDGADKEVDKASFNEVLQKELDKLGDKHKEVFMLRHFDGLSLEEIAETLDINTGTVKSRLHHATKTVADKLEIFRKTLLKE